MSREKFHSVEDFVSDESFQNYCLNKPGPHMIYWDKYINAHPEQAEIISEAKFYVKLLGSESENSETKQATSSSGKCQLVKRWIPAIAIGIILVMTTFTYKHFYSTNHEFILITKKAEQQHQPLLMEDLTKIVLRKNSEIQLLESWKKSEEREIWLDGEAYFEVPKSNPNNKPFIVRLSKGSLSLTAGQFLVKSDTTYIQIVIDEGKSHFRINSRIYELHSGDALRYSDDKVTILNNQKMNLYDNWRHE